MRFIRICFFNILMLTFYQIGNAQVCPAVVPFDDPHPLCDGFPNDPLTIWMNGIVTNNAPQVADPNTGSAVIFSTDAPGGVSETNPPTSPPGDGIHSLADKCIEDVQFTHGYLLCFGADGNPGGGDDSYLFLGTQTTPVRPSTQDPIINTSMCTVTLTLACPNDTWSNPTNATGGANLANFDINTGIYTGVIGDTAGTFDVTIANMWNCNPFTYTINTPACSDVSVPTMGQWGLIILVLFFLIIGLVELKRREIKLTLDVN